MMINKNKRSFISESYKWSLLFLLGQISLSTKVKAQYKAKIVIIGAGFGGATCLNYLSNFSNLIDLTIIDKNERIQTCPFSNLVIGDIIKTSQITFSYKKNPNINFLQNKIKFINSEKKKIFFFDNSYLDFDYLILSPGIGYKNKQIQGYSITNERMVPHCWDGEKKIKIFKQRLEVLDDKYPILISAPDYPYRCPPAPYERASMIANYMKERSKNFKILIFDSKDTFTKKEIFFDEWKKIYGDSIEWIPRKKGGKIQKISKDLIYTNDGEKIKSKFIHIIPEQRASALIYESGLISGDWCKIDPTSFQLKNYDDIYVLGDSIDAGDMPKSAFSANSQAKVLSINLVNRILQKKYIKPVFLNTCYSFSAKNRAFSISSWYKLNKSGDRIVSIGSSQSSNSATNSSRKMESIDAFGWYDSITKDLYA
ncbi:hypothetical protein CBE37_04335 [bacterium TMED277]|nr:MAG: hypothetical protein CBE37_04335 [bacterium TMED277]